MGWYRDRVLPHLIDRACARQTCAVAVPRRARSRWHGGRDRLRLRSQRVGLPDRHHDRLRRRTGGRGRRLAARRIAASPVPVKHIGLRGESIRSMTTAATAPCRRSRCAPFPTSSGRWPRCAGCSVLVVAALPRARVLARPVGRGVAAPHRAIQKRSRWVHLTREPAQLVRDAGFEIEQVESATPRVPNPVLVHRGRGDQACVITSVWALHHLHLERMPKCWKSVAKPNAASSVTR